MQTFLPYPEFQETAKVLDYRRLGKQRVETYQLLLPMLNKGRIGWINHPAFKMWNGYGYVLCDYGIIICKEWIRRGYKDSMLEKIEALQKNFSYKESPSWLGRPDFHASHRAALLYKDAKWYGQFGWIETPAVPIKISKQGAVTLPYIWPVK